MVTEWIAGCGRKAAWLSLDEGDNDFRRFITYLLTALRSIGADIKEGLFGLLQSPQTPQIDSFLTVLLNAIAFVSAPFVVVLDDYHVIQAGQIDHVITLLLERMPPQMHLVIITREDPRLPMARLRVRDQLTEIRASDLRFTSNEAAEFLDRVMGLSLSPEDIGLLESRVEGWIAGLQLAVLSMKGQEDTAKAIHSFTGSHHFVADYLIEEVLKQQSGSMQTFLLYTSILDRLSGPLCDAVLRSAVSKQLAPSLSGQEVLEYLEHANLFIVPLDNERRWYRYHHLFADLLRKRLHQGTTTYMVKVELHRCASKRYEENGFEIEAFEQAVAAQDANHAARLAEGKGMPLLFRGAVAPVLKWLESMPNHELDAMPALWVMYASALLMAGKMIDVEPKLQAADLALQVAGQNMKTRDIIGRIAVIRATLAVSKHQVEVIMAESRRALDYLDPDNLPVRTATTWTLGYAYQLQGDRASAGKAYNEALSISQRIGHVMVTILASLGIGNIQESENRLHVAAETYRCVLKIAGDPPLPIACEAHLGLARIYYEWNDLEML